MRGLLRPLTVHYALYEAERAVFILDVELVLDSQSNGSP